LDAQSKQQLFHDIHQLRFWGVFVIADIIAPARGCCRCAWDTAVRQRALDLDGTDAFAMFEREKWNMYRYGDPEELTNHQALLNNCAGLSR